jgi:hypothetical protein
MDRRSFIKNVSATSTALYCTSGLAISHQPPDSLTTKSADIDDINISINVNFGDGFEVQEVFSGAEATYANISNRDNYYLVSSDDLMNWHIVSSTPM